MPCAVLKWNVTLKKCVYTSYNHIYRDNKGMKKELHFVYKYFIIIFMF